MHNLVVLFIHFVAILARLLGPGGVRSIVAESLLLKHQLMIVNRSRQRSSNLSAWDRTLACRQTNRAHTGTHCNQAQALLYDIGRRPEFRLGEFRRTYQRGRVQPLTVGFRLPPLQHRVKGNLFD